MSVSASKQAASAADDARAYANDNEPTPSLDKIEGFLREHVRSAIHLVSIVPDGEAVGRDFGDDETAAAQWAAAENAAGKNLYWTANIAMPRLNKKPSKKDIIAARFAHSDIDPPKGAAEFDKQAALASLSAHPLPPTFVIDSGNGLQPLWHLATAPRDWQQVEDINHSIAEALGGDHCHNIDRLLRLPGTINYPNKAKLLRGCAPVMASLVHSGKAIYNVTELAKAFPPIANENVRPDAVNLDNIELVTADDLGLDKLSPLRSVIDRPAGKDRSADAIRCARDLLRAKFSPEQIAGVLLNPANAVNDHFREQKDPRRAVLRAIEYVTASDNEPKNDNEPKKRLLATPYKWKDPAKIVLRDWLYGHLLIRKFVTATVAPGGVGKSTLALVEALAKASGKDILGVLPQSRLRVWYWNLEDPQEEIDRKIQAAALYYSLTPGDLDGHLFVNGGRDETLVIAETKDGNANILRPVTDALVDEINANGIDVIVVDPFVSSHRVNENSNEAMDLVVKEWARVADKTNCAVHLVHHTRKQSGNEVNAESARGGKAFSDACRIVRAVNGMSNELGEKAGVKNHRLYFRAYGDKANLAPPAEQSDWYKLESVHLGNGPFWDRGGDSVGVATTWQWPKPLDGVTGSDFDKAAVAIRAGKWRENVQAKDWVGIPVAKALGLNLQNKADKARTRGIIRAWLAAGSLIVVDGKDEKREIKKFVEVLDDDVDVRDDEE